MSRPSQEQLAKEMQAQKARAKARAYIMENGCGPGEREAKILQSGAVAASSFIAPKTNRDNTLEEIKRRKAASIITGSSITSVSAGSTASSTPAQSSQSPLPPHWKAVTDPSTHETYYWNTETNVTQWDRPEPPTRGAGDLPIGWTAVLHTATGQWFYQHQVTGEKRWKKPLFEGEPQQHKEEEESKVPTTTTSDKPTNGTKRKAADGVTHEGEDNRGVIRQRAAAGLDPLSGDNDNGGRGRAMADPTAGGALWQQRPYPAPGAVLRGLRK